MRSMSSWVAALMLIMTLPTTRPKSDDYPTLHWATTRPAEVGIDPVRLNRGLDDLGPRAGNIAVVCRGMLIASRGAIERPVPIFSASKSLTAMVFGVLMQRGDVRLNDPVAGSNQPAGQAATFQNFLTMTSDFGLDPHAPGQHFAYNNNAVHFYGQYMQANWFKDARSPIEVMQQCLLGPVCAEDAVGFKGQWGGWGGGFSVSARDMARLGYLVLRRGRWMDRQLLLASFIDDLYCIQIPACATFNRSHGPNDQFNQIAISEKLKESYSFGWWLGPAVDGRAEYIYMAGRGGNFVIVHPGFNVVLAVTNTHPEQNPTAEQYVEVIRAALTDHRKEADDASSR